MRGWLILLLLLPGAQAMSVQATGPDHQIVPGEPWPMDVTVTVECAQVLLDANLEPRVALSFQTPPGLSVSGDTSVPVDREACALEETVQVGRTFDVAAGMDVEAETPHIIGLSAAMDNSDVQATGELAVQTAFVSLFNATAPLTSKAAGPQEQITYHVTITNHGNAKTTFSFKVVEVDGPGQIVLPTEAVLDQAGGEFTRTTATVVFATPFKNGQNDEHTEFQVIVASASAMEGTPGAEQPLAFEAETKGLYVPGLPLAVLVGMLLMLARRR